MKQALKIYTIALVLISFLIMFHTIAFSQQEQKAELPAQPQIETQAPTMEVPKTETKQPETQWVWGEVVSVDNSSGQLTVKYIDYETDSEKDITISTSAETTYENATALADIKVKDTVSIDYTVSPEGKNMANKISVEKAETSPTETNAPAETNTPIEPAIPLEPEAPQQ